MEPHVGHMGPHGRMGPHEISAGPPFHKSSLTLVVKLAFRQNVGLGIKNLDCGVKACEHGVEIVAVDPLLDSQRISAQDSRLEAQTKAMATHLVIN